MVRCRICARDASAGFVQGFPPSPDSQKMALCPEHDSPENRRELMREWEDRQESAIFTAMDSSRLRTGTAVYKLVIGFMGGGVIRLSCHSAMPTDYGTLKVTCPDGTVRFFPLGHIREYRLEPQLDPLPVFENQEAGTDEMKENVHTGEAEGDTGAGNDFQDASRSVEAALKTDAEQEHTSQEDAPVESPAGLAQTPAASAFAASGSAKGAAPVQPTKLLAASKPLPGKPA